MDSFTPCANLVSEDNISEPYVYSIICENHIEHKRCTCSCMIETAQSMTLEVLEVSSVDKKDDLTAKEAGSSLGGILCFHDLHAQSSDLHVTSNQDETVNSNEIGKCNKFCQFVSLDAKVQKGLRKCATFPCPVEVQPKEGLPSSAVQSQHPHTTGSPSYARSMSLPATFKVVSAMKGGRAQNGISPNEKLHVKWAPEVYDPPETIMSHTVKNHHHRPKAKKKDNHKHKNKKGKSSRASGNEKKNANQRSIGNIPDHLDTRLPPTGDGLLLNGYAKANMEIFTVNDQEAKCSTSYLKEGLARVHLSIGEAS